MPGTARGGVFGQHPRKRRGKRYDCDWVAAKARKRCKKKNKIGVRASEACECACA